MPSTLTFNPELKAILDAIVAANGSKVEWSNALKTALGPARRVRCYHDANASATNPVLTGAEFLNVGSTGELTISSGNVTGFGLLSNVTLQQATNLANGKSALRIEGNGNWMQGTLGLPGAATDFTISASPTTTTGAGFTNTAQVKAPRFLPSGTGRPAPVITDTTPSIIELEDWTDPANPVVIGHGTFTTRTDDWVFEDPDMAAEIGDVAIYQLDNTIKWNTAPATQRFELGGLLLIAPAYNTEAGTVQLEQMLCSFKPLGRWASYPAMDTFIRTARTATLGTDGSYTYGPVSNASTADSTYPPPFKIKLYTAAGYNNGAPGRTPLFTHEIKAFNDKPTMPINSPLCSQEWTSTEPLIPHFNCGMMLPWTNQRTKISAKSGTYFNGVTASSYGPKVARVGYTTNPTLPLIDAYDQFNGQNHMFAMPAYPMRVTDTTSSGNPTGYQADQTYLDTYDDKPADPNLFNRATYFPQMFRTTGYKYQPGSISGHDWRTGPGGSRFDRSAISSMLAVLISDPNYVRPLGNVPIRDMAEDWGLAYFNHSNHWLTNVQTFATVPKQGVLNGDWVFASSYYGSGPYGALGQPRGPQNTIDVCGVHAGQGVSPENKDASGRLYYGGWNRDSLHSYGNAAWWAIMLNSPMHAIAATHDFNTQWMSSLADAGPTSDPTNGGNTVKDGGGGWFMVRIQAWRWMTYALQWKVATQHTLGYTRREIENRFQIELETLYDKVYKPAFVDNDPRIYFDAIRKLGTPVKIEGSIMYADGGTLGLYMAHVLVMLKQFGLWSVMKAKNAKCKAALEMMITCNDKFVIDYFYEGKARDSFYQVIATKLDANHVWTTADVPASWAAQSAQLDTDWPVIPTNSTNSYADSQPVWASYKDWITKYNGTLGEQVNSIHLQYQYVKMRSVYFPEYPHARLAVVTAKLDDFYAQKAAVSASGGQDWVWRFASHGELLPPTVVGPN